MRHARLPLLLGFLSFGPACSPPDPTSDAIEALSGISTVYVPIEAASLLSLQGALEEKGYGNVMADDFKPQFVYTQVGFGAALVGYSSESTIPESTLFQTMSVHQWLQWALADETAMGVVLDPEGALPVTLARGDLERALAELPPESDVPLEIRR